MQTKSVLKIIGTILLLFGIFGYLFPTWRSIQFTNNENLFHLLVGLLTLFLAQFSATMRRASLLVLAILFLGLGIYGFTLHKPTDFAIKRVTARLDTVDNYIHLVFGSALAWFWFTSRKS